MKISLAFENWAWEFSSVSLCLCGEMPVGLGPRGACLPAGFCRPRKRAIATDLLPMSQTYTVLPGIYRARADKILSIAFPEHSRAAFQRSFDAGLVRLGGQPITRDRAVSAGDVLEFASSVYRGDRYEVVMHARRQPD